ncbi:MAG: sensor histidine kinase [Eubacteriales bacterium]|nr:sensor histidine kinase [Eubacteriales bacterium]
MKKMVMQSGLMKNSIRILLGIGAVIIAAFLSNYVVINRSYQRESIAVREDFFNEAAEKVEKFEVNLAELSASTTYNALAAGYTGASGFAERWDKREAFAQLAASLMKLNDSIAAVSAYDRDGRVIGSQGTLFAPADDLTENPAGVSFSGVVQVYGGSEPYFQVTNPIYEKAENGSWRESGRVVLLVGTAQLSDILKLMSSAYQEKESYAVILDQSGEVLTFSGNQEIWGDFLDSGNEGNNYLNFEKKLPMSGWSIRYIVPRLSYMSYMNQVQAINVLTYLVTLAAFGWMCYMIYCKVIRPIRRQLAFVVGFTQDTSQRLEVSDKNEFGELEKEINEMLDGIEELNGRIVEGEKRYLKLEYAKKQTEMIAYKNQINPHFMYNALECIRGMALYRGEKEIAKLTGAMSRLFRYNVKGDEWVTVQEMLQNLREYAVIIEYRFMGKIRLEFSVEEETLSWKLPKMLVQPIVENAVRHGVEPKLEKGRVSVSVRKLSGSRMQIQVCDDGRGMNREMLEKQRRKLGGEFTFEDENFRVQGIGLQNVARRMKLFYGESCGMSMESCEGEGTCVTMEMPSGRPEREESADVSSIFSG